jgi:glycosyltransferase involved in cell wall biosynthesis
MPINLSVVILTSNEELNLNQALRSINHWADEVFVLDSGSTDKTIEIAQGFGCTVLINPFTNFAMQRNYALKNFSITSEWTLFLDADEWVTEELKEEIKKVIASKPIENGFYIKRRLIWMRQWIRRGYYPSWQLRLFRSGTGSCEDRAINEHFIVEGQLGRLSYDLIDENQKGLDDWIAKHNDYSTREAAELVNSRNAEGYSEIKVNFWGGQAQRRRWLRYHVWNRLPLFIRPFLYFLYRYFLLLGFLDGKKAFLFHFMQALWYPMLIDAKYMEILTKRSKQKLKL